MNCKEVLVWLTVWQDLKNPALGQEPGEDVPEGARSGVDPGHAAEREGSLRWFNHIRLLIWDSAEYEVSKIVYIVILVIRF